MANGRRDAPEGTEVTLDEYLQFLDEYWEIFGPPEEPKPKPEYTEIRI